MNGPEHYAAAEQLLARTEEAVIEGAAKGGDHMSAALELAPASLAAAQVHATLAHAAATERVAQAIENLPTYEGMLSVYAFGVNGR